MAGAGGWCKYEAHRRDTCVLTGPFWTFMEVVVTESEGVIT